ncbi:MAG: DUF4440 domain-containing protein [Microbacterium sp.]|uniref:SnoaL-like domain protein n=1 Tax=Microbacterium ginsengisoli TaxID=400772 RepID=A0A0F0LNR8_9MICO|nr:nuclear transport factor 2 family protein [Microbacterium ginsengisoli]KJL34788.1 SnoaL-like domain protein [Microbacterium ginsengisoli]KJL35127.1 SnoaL-like domain protein [Microbacterium ginsengisoli]MAL05643.1 DUF4440 domain-containing protein [Microbacterium sp.]MBN9207595.1 nuclear transport factor 2 family protein [Microbacterium ginsengisoli]
MTRAHDIITRHYEASAGGDLAGMLAPIEADTTWTEAAGFPRAGTYIGPDAVRVNVFEALARDFDGYRFDLDELVDAGDVQVGIGTYSGTFRQTGRPFTARVAHIWRLASDRVVSFEQIVDSAQVRTAMTP